MRTLVRVTQYGVAALLLHFCVTIYGQTKPKTEFFSNDVSDNFDEVYDKFIRVTAENCHIKVWYYLQHNNFNDRYMCALYM